MRTFAVAATLLLWWVPAAYADPIWDFSWATDAIAITTPSNTAVSFHSAGDSVGTFTVAPAGMGPTLTLTFDTPAGPTAFGIGFSQFPQEVIGNVPILLPEPPPGEAFRSAPGPQPGWVLHGVIGTYEWTGDYAHPDTFTIDAFAPGSGPDSGIRGFVGIGTLSGGPVTTPAVESDVLLLGVGGLVGTVLLRRRRPRETLSRHG